MIFFLKLILFQGVGSKRSITDIPINEVCSEAPCDRKGGIIIICNLCKEVPEEFNRTIGEICATDQDPCFSPNLCKFCKLISDLEPSAPPFPSEILLAGPDKISLPGEENF